MKLKNKIALILLITTTITGSLGVYFFINKQKSPSIISKSSSKNNYSIKLKPYKLTEQLGTVEPVRELDTINFAENNALIADGSWVNQSQKLSNTGVFAPINGIFSIQDKQPKIYYPESQILFYVSENEVNQVHVGMPIKFTLLTNSLIQGNTTIKSISATSIESKSSISNYKVTSEVLNQDRLNLHKVKFGQHVTINLSSSEFILPKSMIKNNGIITVKLSNKWVNIHVNIDKYIENRAVILPSKALTPGLEVKK